MRYLELVDALLKDGLQGLGDDSAEAQLAFVLGHQQPDGGFRGRQGSSDLYYTDFALRTVVLLGGRERLPEETTEYLEQVKVHDVLEAFSLLNCERLLGRHLVGRSRPSREVAEALQRQALDTGAFARSGSRVCSAYMTFLAGLIHEMLDEAMPRRLEAARAVADLQQPNGGFREQQGEGSEQTNATAAGVAFLLTAEVLAEQPARRAQSFLVKMQTSDGAFLAHPWATEGDLLSSFTALLTLAGLDGLERLNLGNLARFVKACAAPEGGFKASPADHEPDVEYTYYGLGCLALLRAAAG